MQNRLNTPSHITRTHSARWVSLALLLLSYSWGSSAFAQTVSEEIWQEKPQPKASTQPKPVDLPYCTDIKTTKTTQATKKGQTQAVANSITATINQDLWLRGRACIERDDIRTQADTLHYDYASEQITGEGKNGNAIIHKKNGDTLSGDTIRYNLATGTGSVSPVNMDVKSTEGKLTAESLAILSERRALLAHACYTTCQGKDPDWHLKTDSLLIDQDSDQGTVRNATLVFKGVPVLKMPYAQLPLGNRRQSGFLVPTAGFSTRNGVLIETPYYFNIAPNYDATLSPSWMSKRGLKIGGEYRYLTKWGTGTIYGDWLPYDRSSNRERHYWNIQHLSEGQLGNGQWQARIDAQRASDNQFIDDFGGRDSYTDSRTIPSEYSLSYQNEGFSARLRHKTYQTLQNSDNSIDTPYNFEPQLNLNYHQHFGRWNLYAQAESTQFSHPDRVNNARGWRHILYPAIAYEWRTPGMFFIPKIGIHATRYDLDFIPAAQRAQYDANAHRILPIFSVDGGLVLERQDTWFGKNVTQTLEPRVYYANIPYRHQSQIWNFDSALADLDFSRIYSENLFTGSDRISQSDQVTTGVTSRILARDTGEELFQFGLAQRYYFDKQSVTLPDETIAANNANRKSDLLGAVSGKVLPHLWVQGFAQYNAQSGQLLRTDAALRWQPAYRHVLNLGYHRNLILAEPSKTAYASTQFPANWISNNLYMVARLNYNLNARQVSDAYAGFEYARDCWIFRLVGQHSIDTSGRVNNGVQFQLELKGLGNLGRNAEKTLSNQIDGYHPVNFQSTPQNAN